MTDFFDNEELLLSVPTPDELGVKFRIEQNGDLWVNYQPSGFPVQLEAEHLGYVMDLAGFSAEDYPPEDDCVALLIEAIRMTQATDMRLGGPVDSFVEVHLSPNEMLAGVVIHPAKGKGKNLSRPQLYEALRSARIIQGVVDSALDELTSPQMHAQLKETNQAVCMLLAFGEPAQEGKNAWLESLAKSVNDRRPQVDDQGNINFLELGDFPHIEANTLLARRHPPTKGKNGWTITGKVLKAKDGKDFVLKEKDSSVKLVSSDSNLLITTIAGMPVIEEKSAYVEQILNLDEVGLKTGHIRFDGSVHIKGNVNPGMKVEVTGDIKIGGLIEAAWVKAKGSIEVNGGIIGRKAKESDKEANKDKETPAAEGEDNKKEVKINSALVKAGIRIKAKFVQEAKLIAGEEIFVAKQVLHSDLNSGIKIFLPGKAAIVGGTSYADKLIDIGASGNSANITTKLIVGDTRELKSQMNAVNRELQQLEIQKSKLLDLIKRIKQQGKSITEEKKQQILSVKKAITEKEEAAYNKMKYLNELIKEKQNARVQIRSNCYIGSSISIDNEEFTPRNDLGKVTFYLRDGEINMR